MKIFNPYFFSYRSLWLLALSSLMLSACTKPSEPQQKSPATESQSSTSEHVRATAELSSLNIGYQKAALKLIVAKKNQFFEQQFPNLKIQWKEFPAGPQTLEALSVGAIDFGYTGDVPIIFSLAASKELKYLAYEDGAKQSHALLLPLNSPIKRLSDLKGKRIGLTKGSSAHYFLAQSLNKAGLAWSDIQAIWLTPADGRAALDKKAIDAWATWEPYVSATEMQGDAVNLFDSSQLDLTYSFYPAQTQFVQQHPQLALQVIQVLNQTDQWIQDHPEQAAQILAQSTGLGPDVAAAVLHKKPNPNPVALMTPSVLRAQQKIADTFYQLKLIPTQIQVDSAEWNGN